MAILNVSDEVVIGFFSASVLALVGAIGVLWRQMLICNDDRKKLWTAVNGKQDVAKCETDL